MKGRVDRYRAQKVLDRTGSIKSSALASRPSQTSPLATNLGKIYMISIPEIEQPNFSVSELAEYLRVTPSYIHRQCREGKLECFNIGSRRIIPARAVYKLIETGYEPKEHDGNLCQFEMDDGSPCMKRRVMYSDLCWSHSPR